MPGSAARRRGRGRALASAHCARYRPTVPRATTKSDTKTSHWTSPSHEPRRDMVMAHTRRASPQLPRAARAGRGARGSELRTSARGRPGGVEGRGGPDPSGWRRGPGRGAHGGEARAASRRKRRPAHGGHRPGLRPQPRTPGDVDAAAGVRDSASGQVPEPRPGAFPPARAARASSPRPRSGRRGWGRGRGGAGSWGAEPGPLAPRPSPPP